METSSGPLWEGTIADPPPSRGYGNSSLTWRESTNLSGKENV